MGKMIFGGMILALVILVGGLIYTFKASRLIDTRQSEYDAEISGKVRRHPYSLNPVFLSYIIGIGLALLFILYLAMSSNW